MDSPQPLDVYFLRFVPDSVPKIAYATSISCPNIPEELQSYYNKSIVRLNAISIREKSFIGLSLQDLAEWANVVLDPAMLLTSSMWVDALGIGHKQKGDYIFLYLRSSTKEDRILVQRVRKETGLPVIASPDLLNGKATAWDVNLADIEDKDMIRYIAMTKACRESWMNSKHAFLSVLCYPADLVFYNKRFAGLAKKNLNCK